MQEIERQQLFNALADPTRRNIVELLATQGQMNATDICENFDISHPAISQHLKILREADLVRLQKDAQRHLYSLNIDAIHKLDDWVKQMTRYWDETYDRLDQILEAEKKKTLRNRR
ncbi:MAG TPA: metalloregulator ArsR/SmtB family transcription factor [Candidatus Bathyarchaeia archaeon]|nr:metalloregulator ArsR/SmtB family transcription factor [Candidatus Bathyarchaeia archaeon]